MSRAAILVVEDEAIVAKNIGLELTGLGYSICGVATRGEDALRLATDQQPDLVLMDIALNGELDGVETTRRLREQMDVPVVYLTAYADEPMLKRAKETAPSGYLLKPYEERELHTTIQIALHNHKLNRALKETQQWLGFTVHCLPDGVIVTDAKGHVRLLNPAAAELTGWSLDKARGTAWTNVAVLVHEDTHAALNNVADRALRSGHSVRLGSSCLLLAKDGRHRQVEGTVTAVSDHESTFIGWVILLRDVAARRRMEASLRQCEEQLRRWACVESVDRLATGMARDFNHLLTVILSNLSLVRANGPRNDSDCDALDRAEEAALVAAEEVKQLVAFTRPQKGRWGPVKLNAVVAEVAESLTGLLDPRTSIRFTPAEDLWVVHGDRDQLREAVLNLCLNAGEALPRGGEILVQTENVQIGPGVDPGHIGRGRGYVRLRVCDAGPGTPPEARSRRAESFFTTKEPQRGLGVGLALVWAMVERHGGWIDCYDEVGLGACFEIYLPRRTPGPKRCPNGAPNAAHPKKPAGRPPADLGI
jgi:PAS domain S-box-containing protein